MGKTGARVEFPVGPEVLRAASGEADHLRPDPSLELLLDHSAEGTASLESWGRAWLMSEYPRIRQRNSTLTTVWSRLMAKLLVA